ncbi:hypothetical protein BD408DRAFT_402423 [Parasitella parasitica]|nr:hypothetical protein BD408DRAFT_402423 [Parasitella parasitica]
MLLRSGFEFPHNPVVNRKRKVNEDPYQQQPSRKQKLNPVKCEPATSSASFSATFSASSSPRHSTLPSPLALTSLPSFHDTSLPSPSPATSSDTPIPRLVRTESTYELFPPPTSPFPSPSVSPSHDQRSPSFSILSPTLASAPMARDMSASSYDTAPLILSQDSVESEDDRMHNISSRRQVNFNEFVLVYIYYEDDQTTMIRNTHFYVSL